MVAVSSGVISGIDLTSLSFFFCIDLELPLNPYDGGLVIANVVSI